MLGLLAQSARWFGSVTFLRSAVRFRVVRKLREFTVFACLATPISLGIIRTRFNKPAWDTSTAFC